ncbi:MAG: thiol-disulfide oxidoreductase DCC family protein [bacterium]|jgi:predicted DCC family thiol-disulfide oxidoreductase YuxK
MSGYSVKLPGRIDQAAMPLIVYYDASCELCASEIRMLAEGDRHGHLRLVDCSAPCFDDRAFKEDGVTREQMMAAIHARDVNGQWYRGVDVFALAYAAAGLPGIARFWASARLRPLFERAYPWVARHRAKLSRLGLPRLFSLVRSTRARSRRDAPANGSDRT